MLRLLDMLDTPAVARSLTDAEFTSAQADAITAAERSGHVTADPFKAGLAVLMAGMTRVRLVHLLELRKSLEALTNFMSSGWPRSATMTVWSKWPLSALGWSI